MWPERQQHTALPIRSVINQSSVSNSSPQGGHRDGAGMRIIRAIGTTRKILAKKYISHQQGRKMQKHRKVLILTTEIPVKVHAHRVPSKGASGYSVH